jgi:hypothetical protein
LGPGPGEITRVFDAAGPGKAQPIRRRASHAV